MSNPRACPHCYPAPNNHLPRKLGSFFDFYLSAPLGGLLSLLLPANFSQTAKRSLKQALLNFATATGHVQLTETLNRSHLDNRTLVFWDQAQERGLKIQNLKLGQKHTEHFCLWIDDKKYYFDANPIFLVNEQCKQYSQAARYDDKAALKKILMAKQLPCPEGRAFISKKRALAYGLSLGFPLIVKPSWSSLSCHVSFNLNSVEELKKAIALAKQVDYKIIVEQYIPGEVYRAVVVKDKFVACLRRQAGSIMGDGKSSIEQLIDAKNRHPARGVPGQKNFTLFEVKKNKPLMTFLTEQGVNFHTVLKKHQRIFLSPKMNLGNGGDLTNVTGQAHPENIKLFEKVHQVLNLPLSGLDFICQDISLPWSEQPFAFIENNSLPNISMHHHPSEGEAINVAGMIWDFVLGTLN